MTALFADHTLRVVALGAGLLGAVSGALGSFAMLRRQSLLGDAISHAALPGIAVAFMLTRSKAPVVLMLGAALAGWLATLAVMTIVTRSRIKYDGALGIVLSVFFGLGLVLLTLLQKRPDASQAGLDRYLFGQAAALLVDDVRAMAIIGAGALAVLAVLWKEFKLISVDADFGAAIGLPVRLLDTALTSLLVIAIVIGLQTVGVVLMSAMVVAPAAAARQWTNRLGPMVALAAGFGVVAGVGGAVLSSIVARLPTGPTIVLALSGLVLVSLLIAPARGLAWRALRRGQHRRTVEADAVLLDLYALALQHEEDLEHGHDEAVLRAMRGGQINVRRSLEKLAQAGLARRTGHGRWALSAAGRARALEQIDHAGEHA
ncbi:MAG: metal ABC transporter permease [Acidobacteriota bacterium]|nr:MAG: metal ABC transporter permease [Acidobacteriota bacterium]